MGVSEADVLWMQRALDEALKARDSNEVPVGAVLVRDRTCLAQSHNQPIGQHDPSAHAEIRVLREAGQLLENYRLTDCELYVTLEPCVMCVGALIQARVKRVIFGAADPKTGALGGAFNLFEVFSPNHVFDFSGGCLATESKVILQDFFRQKRT